MSDRSATSGGFYPIPDAMPELARGLPLKPCEMSGGVVPGKRRAIVIYIGDSRTGVGVCLRERRAPLARRTVRGS